jgi:hypothetical protein
MSLELQLRHLCLQVYLQGFLAGKGSKILEPLGSVDKKLADQPKDN